MLLPTFDIIFHPVTLNEVVAFVVVLVLLAVSAFMSAAEVGYFSLTPQQVSIIKTNDSSRSKLLTELLSRPARVLATILIANNFVNIGIVIISDYLTNNLIDFSKEETLGFVFKVILVTFMMLLFSELLPKIYATRHTVGFANFMTYPLWISEKIFLPLSKMLVATSDLLSSKTNFNRKQNFSRNDLQEAIKLTKLSEERKMLDSIARFGNKDVKDIMRPRMDVVAVDINTEYEKLLEVIVECGYSRIPIYSQSFDHIKGILYIKDLLPFLHVADYDWKQLVRQPYFVPETKKINDLLGEFQQKKIHVAIVVDEFGGANGMVTMEDVLEEIIGEINDEFDEEEKYFVKIDDRNYEFEGKIQLNDFYKILQVSDNVFDGYKGEAETLAGLILEMRGEIPNHNEVIEKENYIFKIISVDKRRIKRIHVTIKDNFQKTKQE